jgi:DNA-binding transcriptional regulator YbjK
MATATTSQLTPAPGSRPRGEARRDALLRATLAVIGEAGADAVTHRRVAEAAGLPLASTTYWFDSKEHLLTEAFSYAADRDLERLRAEMAAVGERPTVAEIVDVVAWCESDGDRGSLLATYALVLEAARRPALQKISRRWTEAYLEGIGGLLARAGSTCPAADARVLIAAADGLQLDRLAGGDDAAFDSREHLTRLAGALLHRQDAR